MKKKMGKNLTLRRETLARLVAGLDYIDPTTLGSYTCIATPAPCSCVM